MMHGLMASLLAVLEGKGAAASAIIERTDGAQEPESLFYLARHFALLGDAPSTIRMIQKSRLAGFCSSHSLGHDA